jgi:hypothetical protein
MKGSGNKKENVDCPSFLYIIGLKKCNHTFAFKQFREKKILKEHASRRKVLHQWNIAG